MKIDTARILESVSMEDIINKYGLVKNQYGYISCPIHNEKTPSLKIYPGRKGFYCFGCHAGGDVISFIMHYFNINFRAAVIRLDYDFNLGLNLSKTPNRTERAEMAQIARERKERIETQEAIKNANDAAYWALWDEWIRLDRNLRDFTPKNPNEPLHHRYYEAIHRIGYQEYLIDQAISFNGGELSVDRAIIGGY